MFYVYAYLNPTEKIVSTIGEIQFDVSYPFTDTNIDNQQPSLLQEAKRKVQRLSREGSTPKWVEMGGVS